MIIGIKILAITATISKPARKKASPIPAYKSDPKKILYSIFYHKKLRKEGTERALFLLLLADTSVQELTS